MQYVLVSPSVDLVIWFSIKAVHTAITLLECLLCTSANFEHTWVTLPVQHAYLTMQNKIAAVHE
jgi:hypothetical protein